MAHVSIQDAILAALAQSGPMYTGELVKAVGLQKRRVTDSAAHVRAKGFITSNRANIGTPCRYAITNAGRIKMGITPVKESVQEGPPEPEFVAATNVEAGRQIPENPFDLAFQIEALAKLAQDVAEEKAKARESILLNVEKRARSNAISRAQTKANNHADILRVVVATQGLRTYEIAKAVGRDDSKVREILRELEAEGKVRDVGSVKAPKWVAA